MGTCPMFQGKICGGNGECFIKTTGKMSVGICKCDVGFTGPNCQGACPRNEKAEQTGATSTQLNGLNAPATRAGSPTTVLSAYAELRRASSTRRQRNAPALLVRCAVSVRQCAWLK